MDQVSKKKTTINKIAAILTVVVIMIAGLGIRIYDITDYPFDFHPTRQMHSYLIARGMYYENNADYPEWQQDMAVQQWHAEGFIEPQIMEALTAMGYRIAGTDLFWIPRLLSILFWSAGGIAMLLLCMELFGFRPALIALMFYLFLPYGAIASRSFQPDPLMVSMIVFAWWGIARWQRLRTWKATIVAGVLSGLAIFIKAVAVFYVAGAWIGLLLFGVGIKKIWKDPKVWLAGFLSIFPYACYHFYGVYVVGRLADQFAGRFFPEKWLDPVFYLQWKSLISSVTSFEWFIAAAIATLLISSKPIRSMLLGVWAGYFLNGMALSHHFATHDYYHLPLIAMVAVGLAAAGAGIFEKLIDHKWLSHVVVYGLLLFASVLYLWDVRVHLKRIDYHSEIKIWTEIGETIGNGAPVVSLAHDYGYRLSYWSWITPTNWGTSADFNFLAETGQTFEFQDLFNERVNGKDYFVVTLFSELDRQPALKAVLENHYTVFAESGDYIIYDLRQEIP
ncbi:MAG: glycosyltransferase family 39 protein [Anaerolineaceae bacterium]|nr:glycosyltransferase family 39 protein [Anaerolineaceae bacterium]